MPDDSKLIQSAMMIREASPQAWDNFLLSLREYSGALNMELVRAEPTQLARSQGMAMAIQDLVVTLLKAPETYDKRRTLQQGRKNDGRDASWTV